MNRASRALGTLSIGGITALFLVVVAGCSKSGDDPFGYTKVSGTVTYEDGTKIPGTVYICFSSESPPIGNKQPKQGMATLGKDGEFHEVTSHKYGDGIVRGKHKVTLCGDNNSRLPPSVVPPEYCDVKKTPLEVDTDNPGSFTLKVRKPAEQPPTNPKPASTAGRH